MKAEQLIDEALAIRHPVSEELINENLVKILWKKLPSNIKSKVDMKRLTYFVSDMESGANLAQAASNAGIPMMLAVDLMAAVQRTGLL